MFGMFKLKKAEVLSHWYTPVPNFNLSTQDFYAAVEKELQAQKLPGLEISRVEFSEGGLLSDKRTYLRLTRERLAFDICAAPFGTNYFYSCRLVELPVKVNLIVIILLFFGFLILLGATVQYFGFFATLFFGTAILVLGVYTLRNLVSLGLETIDAALLESPFIGPVYERFFREETTYYHEDTRLMYLTTVDDIVNKLVEQETGAKGLKLLTQYERSPILGELYKSRPFGITEKQKSA